MQRTKWCVTNVIYIPMDFRCSWHGAQTPMVRPRNCSHIQSLWHPWYWSNETHINFANTMSNPCGSLGIPDTSHQFHSVTIANIIIWSLSSHQYKVAGLLAAILMALAILGTAARWNLRNYFFFILIAARAPTVVDLLLEKMRNSISYHNDGQWMENGDDE